MTRIRTTRKLCRYCGQIRDIYMSDILCGQLPSGRMLDRECGRKVANLVQPDIYADEQAPKPGGRKGSKLLF